MFARYPSQAEPLITSSNGLENICLLLHFTQQRSIDCYSSTKVTERGIVPYHDSISLSTFETTGKLGVCGSSSAHNRRTCSTTDGIKHSEERRQSEKGKEGEDKKRKRKRKRKTKTKKRNNRLFVLEVELRERVVGTRMRGHLAVQPDRLFATGVHHRYLQNMGHQSDRHQRN